MSRHLLEYAEPKRPEYEPPSFGDWVNGYVDELLDIDVVIDAMDDLFTQFVFS